MLDGLTARVSASSIMNVSRRLPRQHSCRRRPAIYCACVRIYDVGLILSHVPLYQATSILRSRMLFPVGPVITRSSSCSKNR